MSLLEHLEELRRRLIVVVVAVALAAIIGFVLSQPVLEALRAPLPPAYRTLFVLTVTGAFGVRVKIAVFLGIALAMPVILFEIWRFVTPGLTRRERRLVWPLIVAALLLFAIGMAVGYLIIPFALKFLLSFVIPGEIQPLLTIDEYVGFVTS